MKKASLNLSVNAIVVFILAFAMLGVGLFLINTIRDKMSSGVGSAFDMRDLENPPSADKPLTIPNEIQMKANGDYDGVVGVYARTSSISGLRFDIKGCDSGAQDDPADDLITVVGGGIDIDMGNGKGYDILVKTKNPDDHEVVGFIPGTTYICKFQALGKAGNAQSESVIEEETFRLKIHS